MREIRMSGLMRERAAFGPLSTPLRSVVLFSFFVYFVYFVVNSFLVATSSSKWPLGAKGADVAAMLLQVICG